MAFGELHILLHFKIMSFDLIQSVSAVGSRFPLNLQDYFYVFTVFKKRDELHGG